MVVRASVVPELLKWGRETAGLAVDDAARRLQVESDRLQSWETGEAQPTIGQLRRLADAYHRPFSVFFLPAPPAQAGIDPHDFRQFPGHPPGVLSPSLRYQLRLARERRQIALDLLSDLQEVPRPFNFLGTIDDDPEVLGQRIREHLRVRMDTQERWRQPYDALNGWRTAIESTGVLVFQASRVELTEMRGFSLAEEPLPVVVVNSKDAPYGRIFTLLHELCHIAIRRSGVCEPDEGRDRPPEEQRIEVLCNGVAAAALVPMRELLADQMVASRPGASLWSEQELLAIARRFAVSKFVVLRRLLTAQRTTLAFYRTKHDEWAEAARAIEDNGGGIVTPDRRAVSESGRTFIRLVLQSYRQDRITLSDVSRFLGVRLKHLPKIEQAVGF